jgi:type IV pilus assembly protein PilV
MRSPRKYLQGATLVEILVAVIILSFGLLGIAAMQTRALQGNQSSLQRSQAIMLNNSLLDAMRIDKANMIAGKYQVTEVEDESGISEPGLPGVNLKDWIRTADQIVGSSSRGTVSCNLVNNVCSVTLKWDDSKAGGLSDQSVTITTKL